MLGMDAGLFSDLIKTLALLAGFLFPSACTVFCSLISMIYDIEWWNTSWSINGFVILFFINCSVLLKYYNTFHNNSYVVYIQYNRHIFLARPLFSSQWELRKVWLNWETFRVAVTFTGRTIHQGKDYEYRSGKLPLLRKFPWMMTQFQLVLTKHESV